MKDMSHTSEWWDHLEWLETENPALLTHLLDENKLEEHLYRKMQLALMIEEREEQKGRRMDEATEVVYKTVIAPESRDEELPLTVLSDKHQRQLELFRTRHEQ